MAAYAPRDVAGLLRELATVLAADQVLTDPGLTQPYEVDITGLFGGPATAVVRPGSPGDVAGVLAACRRAGASVVVQGGGTGLVGGGVPAGGEVVLSTRRLAGVGPVVEIGDVAWVDVAAGTTLAAVQDAVRPHGWDVGVDLAARGSATVGGMVATDAGGVHVLRYGPMRDQVLGLRAVLADGTEVGGPERVAGAAAAGDVEDLLVGSEGTLGVLTQVRLRLVRRPTLRAVALVGVASVQAALDALTGVRASAAAPLSAAELMLAPGLALVLAATGLPRPLATDHPAYLLLEVADDRPAQRPDEAGDRLLDDLAEELDQLDGVDGAALAADLTGMARLWAYRESHTDAIARAGRPVKLDVAVPVAALAGFVARLDDLVGAAAQAAGCTDTRVVVFGHLAVGDLHINVLGVDREPAARHAVADAVLREVAAVGGSIAAEHGVGRAKVDWLALSRTPDELAAMRAVKQRLDPGGLLGPGVLLPAGRADVPQTGPP
jgi:FAD/FMN-containing dehydrogenase